MSNAWGHHLTVVTIADQNYVPGVYALFNSLLMNEFCGKLLFLTYGGVATQSSVFKAQPCPRLGPDHSFFVDTTVALAALPDGEYVYLDSDVIIERPCGFLFEPVADSMILSTEPENKADAFDVMCWHQCKLAGVPFPLPAFDYVNAGLLGFSFPRDRAIVSDWSNLCRQLLKGCPATFSHPYFGFLHQDVLNLTVRKWLASGSRFATISTRVLELGSFSSLFQDRAFPYTKQTDLKPRDQIKYLIHGAALRRPWSRPRSASFKSRLKCRLEEAGIGAWWRGTTPYERAWAYYACSDDRPIPLSSWNRLHDFYSHRNFLWRRAHGLS
jgi:hypothetical protein